MFFSQTVTPVVNVDTYVCPVCGAALEGQALWGDNVLFHDFYNTCPGCHRKVAWQSMASWMAK